MISTTPAMSVYEINLHRPDIYNDVDREYWRSVHHLIESCPMDVTVNGAYYFVDDILKAGGGYGGGGMAYKFWFVTDEDKQNFMTAFTALS